MRLRVPILLLLAAAPLCARPIPAAADRAIEAIRTDAIRAHVTFLADDLLEGRAAGTRGYDLAAAYVAAHFERLGLEPAGDDGTWYQQVPFVRSALVPEKTSMVLHRPDDSSSTLVQYDDFIVQANPVATEAEVRAPVVFAGFGVHAPELGWDDYAGIDARGKIVAVLSGAPSQFPSTRRAHFGSSSLKAETAVRMGAVGLLRVRGPDAERRFGWERYRRHARTPSLRWIGPDGQVGRAHPELRAEARLSRSGAEALFDRAPHGLEEVFALESRSPEPLAFDLPVEASIRSATTHERITSPNVAAILPGSDPELAAEVIVYTAHLDHVGITAPVDGDRINNGAFDNASGTSTLLEIARAFRSLPEPPRRAILFLAVTAEEKGLLGSDYFARYPTIDRDRLVANVNMDMFVMAWPLHDVVLYGYEHSSLALPAGRAAEHLGLARTGDPNPEEAIFVRSDQYSFVRQGIPAIYISQGMDTGDPTVSGEEILATWLRTRYHTPKDDLQQPIVWEMGRDLARYAFLAGYLAAEADERPRWNAGDFFGETFAR